MGGTVGNREAWLYIEKDLQRHLVDLLQYGRRNDPGVFWIDFFPFGQ